ncbi:MAG: ADP-ribosylglycohydrolase family protein [Actinomycetia bacterium]|nr:ADP-ribosylglycohydrolase family protein [Actinomycetes bacterium]
MKLTTEQIDRAAGVLLGQACGDALGVPYEFGRKLGPDDEPEMRGGGLGPYAPGEWSDDTQMALCIAQVAATGADLTSRDALDEIAQAFLDWRSNGASDIGIQTSNVLANGAQGSTGTVSERMLAAARALHDATGRTAGNGALMRTGIVGLTRLEDANETADAARCIAELTHADLLAGDACVIWSLAVRRAVLDGTFDGVREGLDHIPTTRRDQWAQWLDEAETGPATRFNPNGFTVHALQAAWSAIVTTPVPQDDPGSGSFPCLHLQESLKTAVRVGDDTDTVAAIAGALLGARWGASAVPAAWRRRVHGWPGMRANDLVRLGVLAARAGRDDPQGWPSVEHFDYSGYGNLSKLVPHPTDDGVLLGAAGYVQEPPQGVDAVVSLCRLGSAGVPSPGIAPKDHVEVWLIDSPDPEANPNLEFVIDDAARVTQQLRAEGRRVLLHCVQAQSRTPTVAARYGVLLGESVENAAGAVNQALHTTPNETLANAVRRLGSVSAKEAGQ